jgi:hypothetical protein
MQCTRIIATILVCLFPVVSFTGCATASAAGQGIATTTKAVGKGVVKGAKVTGRAVKKTGKATGRAAKRTGRAIKGDN